jgi:hypothetical protein
MRALKVALVSGVALAAVSAHAFPLAPSPPSGPVIYLANQEWAPLPNDPSSQVSVDAAPPIQLVAEGCGWGWHRHHWQDRWGNRHWGHCVPDNGPFVGWGTGRYYPYTYRHGAYAAGARGYQ